MTPQEAAQKIGGLAEALLDPVDSGIELAALIEMVDLLDTANRNIRSAAALAERTGSWRRTDIDRDALVKYVRKCALLDDIRMDPETGELRPTEVVALELHQRCFRAEPKWTELKALGVDDDEFCHREFVASVKITKAKVL